MPGVAVDLAALVAGLALLTVGGDRFVLGAARLSVALAISPVLVGAVVIGFGTSLPELVVSALAAAQGTQDLALGNVVGSNTANLLLVLGVAGTVGVLMVRTQTLRRELPLMLGGSALLALVASDGEVSLGDAVALLVTGVLAFGWLTRAALADRHAAEQLSAEVDAYAGGTRPRVGRALVLVLVGMVATLAGAQLLVHGAVNIAQAVGVSDVAIGVTVVAVGTSLPELVTALAAARRHETDLVVGNVLGSNLFNALAIGGIAGLIDTVPLAASFRPNLLVMLVASALAALLLRSGRRLSQAEALLLLCAYGGAIAVAVSAG